MSRHHLAISGTGRAGTTFLIGLMTQLGLDTGFRDSSSDVLPNCRAGMEFDIRDERAPYVIKSPHLCDCLDAVVGRGDIVLDHLIVPVRDLFAAAESRRYVTRTTDPTLYPNGSVPGGLWHTADPSSQESILAWKLYGLIFAAARYDIPLTLLSFPRLVRDPEYLYHKLAFALRDIDYAGFLHEFRALSRPELVHDFGERGSGVTVRRPG